MWVLSTDRAELHQFNNCAAVPGGYAILSHTWSQCAPGEQTFQEVKGIIKECKKKGQNPRCHVGEKIRRCCEIAERGGYHWVWIDSCCIDKTSSTELSEAINSMFTWYALTEVCYVYLEDVPHDGDPYVKGSKFQTARWHSRGWTLQELLAPVFAVFLSQEWQTMGTKYDLRAPLSKCTGIDEEYLTRKLDFRVDASIAKRMSWAAKRKTTRVEDEAYCLLGLFNLNMPTLYGEGRQAFQRLQAELVKQSVDPTLFAWGGLHSSCDNEQEQAPLSYIHTHYHNPDRPDIFPFASSPSDFMGWSDACYPPQAQMQGGLPSSLKFQPSEKGIDGGLPSFGVTPHGMRCHCPAAEVYGITIVVLLCQTRRNTEYLGLLLHPAPLVNWTLGRSRRFYYVSWGFRQPTGHGYEPRRLACLGQDFHNLRFRGKLFSVAWRDIYIVAHSTNGRADGAHHLQRFLPDVASMPFRIPRMLLQALDALGFFASSGTASWDPASNDAVWFGCQSTALYECFRILLGTCTKAPTKGRLCHWAYVDYHRSATWGQPWPEYVHDCSTDHIEDWPNRTHGFGNAERMICLVFTPCTYASERTLVLGLELVGSVYEEVQRKVNVYLPASSRSQRRVIDAELSGGTVGLRPTSAIGLASVASTCTAASAQVEDPSPSSRFPPSQATHQLSGSDASTVRAHAQDMHEYDDNPSPPVVRPSFLDTVIPETTSDMASIIHTLRDEIRMLRAHDAARELEMQELRSAFTELKASVVRAS